MEIVTGGFVGYGVSKLLDGVLIYVGKALKLFDYCEELQTLLRAIKPGVAEAEQSSKALEASGDREAVEQWLNDFASLLKDAEQALSRALGSVPKKSFNLVKRNKHSNRIRELTDRIREVVRDGGPVAILSVVTYTKSDTTAIRSDTRAMRSDTTAIRSDTTAMRSDTTVIRSDTTSMRSALTAFINHHGTQNLSQQGKTAPQHPLVQILTDRTEADERCPVVLKVADTHTPQFYFPGDRSGSESAGREEQRNHRGKVVKGGFEVNNATKLQLTMEPQFGEDWFFYILFLNHLENTLSIYFPEKSSHDYTLFRHERVFPDSNDHDNDPPTMKLERSSNCFSDACERVTLYLLVVETRVEPEDRSGLITVEDVEKHLLSTAAQNAIVNHWVFDIKPPPV